MHWIYVCLTYLVYPIYRLWILPKRIRRAKEDKSRYIEKIGYYNTARPNKKVIWFHAASVGESLSILKLVYHIIEKHKNWVVLITTSTATSAEIVKSNFPAQVIHQYAPLDFNRCVTRFFQHWRPDIGILVESELWPNLIYAMKKHSIKSYLINMRMSNESLRKWLMMKNMFKNLLHVFDKVLTQTEKLKRKLRMQGLNNVEFLGNLKFANYETAVDKIILNYFQNKLSNKKPWVAASTHEGEEEFILKSHLMIKKHIHDACLILIPRHPERCKEIEQNIKAHNLSYVTYSDIDQVQFNHDVLLVDKMGVVPTFFSIANCAFVGGSLIKGIGGHNMIEPMLQNCVPIYGQYTHNFTEIINDIDKVHAGCKVDNTRTICKAVVQLLNNDTIRNIYLKNCTTFLEVHKNIDQKVYEILQPSIK